jgi:hypothetical protein
MKHLNEFLNEEAFKGKFTIDGTSYKSAVVNKMGSDYGVTLFLTKPDYRAVKKASPAAIKVAQDFLGKDSIGGGYDQEGENVSVGGALSEKDAIKLAKHFLTLK